jgi:hypothetical protein
MEMNLPPVANYGAMSQLHSTTDIGLIRRVNCGDKETPSGAPKRVASMYHALLLLVYRLS